MKTNAKRKPAAIERRKKEAAFWEDAAKAGSSAARKALFEKCGTNQEIGDPVEICKRKAKRAREESTAS